MPARPSEKKWTAQNSVPTEADWKDDADADHTLYSLDVTHAFQTFAGKANQEMQSRFFQNVLGCAEDLDYLPRIPFQYYMLGFRDFVMAGNFGWCDSSDAASSFLNRICRKLKEQPHFIRPIMPDLMPAVIYVSENQQLFDADVDIYGNFKAIRRLIEELYTGSPPP